MNMEVLDEREFYSYLQQKNQEIFLKWIDCYERYIAPIMRTKGYKRINEAERTVVFSFGEIRFSRSRWKKGEETRIPVDEKLGLIPYVRYSQEVLYQLTDLSRKLPYRKVVEVVELLNQVYVTKDSVQKAVNIAGDLLEEKEEYRFLSFPEKRGKIKTDTLYIEGDGLWVKQSQAGQEGKSTELAHFVAHTGSVAVTGKRRKLENKVEIVSNSYKKAKEQLLDTLYNQFEITSDTVIVTNSDGGHGYSPEVFKDLASAFRPKIHYHFWDAFHVNELIKKTFRSFPAALTDLAFDAVAKHDKKKMILALDTAESLIEDPEKLDAFHRVKNQFLNNFKYTVTPKNKGLVDFGIGIMESQHRKISYRMKNQGMYWSVRGAEKMSQIIILGQEGRLRDLFFGRWRTEYEKIKSLDNVSASRYLSSSKKQYNLKNHKPIPRKAKKSEGLSLF